MGDGEIVKRCVAQDASRSAGPAGADTGRRSFAAIAAKGLHGAIIGRVGRRAKPVDPIELSEDRRAASSRICAPTMRLHMRLGWFFGPQLCQESAMIPRHGRHCPQSDLGLRHF